MSDVGLLDHADRDESAGAPQRFLIGSLLDRHPPCGPPFYSGLYSLHSFTFYVKNDPPPYFQPDVQLLELPSRGRQGYRVDRPDFDRIQI